MRSMRNFPNAVTDLCGRDDVVFTAVAGLTTLTFHEIVRDRIWQLLNENREYVARLVELCSSPKYGTAFHANMAVSFLLLNPQNVPALRACNAFKQLAQFTEQTSINVPSKEAGFYLNEEVRYCGEFLALTVRLAGTEINCRALHLRLR